MQRHDLVLDRGADLAFERFRAHFAEVAGTEYGMHSPRWVSYFSDTARQAERYRDGQVFVAGDAAHIHYPGGGQGLNLGVQDAFNLGWKLAAAVNGHAPESLLDTYAAERHPVAARVLHNTRAQTAVSRSGPHADSLRDVITDLLRIDDIRYDMPCDHPLAGRRIPDADLATPHGSTRVHALLHAGNTVLLALDERHQASMMVPSAAGRIDVVKGCSHRARWTVPGLGDIIAPTAVLIRPDGYVAWATTRPGSEGLVEALTTWVGAGQ